MCSVAHTRTCIERGCGNNQQGKISSTVKIFRKSALCQKMIDILDLNTSPGAAARRVNAVRREGTRLGVFASNSMIKEFRPRRPRVFRRQHIGALYRAYELSDRIVSR